MKDLASRFSEVELRVRTLIAENRALRAQVRELEREKTAAGTQAQDASRLRARASLVRERLRRLLARLEALEGTGASDGGSGAAREGAAGDGPD